MNVPRRWKLAASLCGPDNLGPAWLETDIIEGPDLAVDEEVEVIECLPGVIIIDELGPDMRGEETPSFSSYRPSQDEQPSPREAYNSIFTPNYEDARGEDTPRFFAAPDPEPLPTHTTRRRTLRIGAWTFVVERRSNA